MDKYTSLELSKKLKEGGCELKSLYKWAFKNKNVNWELSIKKGEYPAYDILNDICVKYADKFFGRDHRHWLAAPLGYPNYSSYFHIIGSNIMRLLQENKKQEAEDYIFEHCLFNKEK